MSEESIPILLDTDIGSDIDDAVALAYLLCQPRCDLVGLTTVTGVSSQRAAIADAICRAAGKTDFPIHCGADSAIPPGKGQQIVHQFPALKDIEHRADWPANTAVDFLRKTIRDRPGELTLLSIGPMTNIGLLFAIDPEIPSLLKQYICMAGCFFMSDRDQEYNVMLDPSAAAIAYAAHAPKHTSYGLDVTYQCKMKSDQVREKFRGQPLKTVHTLAEHWFTLGGDEMTFHDPLAAVCLFEPDICKYRNGHVTIPWSDSQHMGATRFTEGAQGSPHTAAYEVDSIAFFDAFFSVFH